MRAVLLLSGVALASTGQLRDAHLTSRADRVNALLNSSPSVAAAMRTVASLLQSPAQYVRPLGSFLQQVVDYQPIPALPGSADLLVSEAVHVRKHIEAALKLAHPMPAASFCASADTVDAARCIMSFGGDATAITEWRKGVMSQLMALRPGLADVEKELRALMLPGARAVLKGDYSLALWAVIRRSIGCPDELFTAHQCSGFPCIGDYPDSGWFRKTERPAWMEFDTLLHPEHQKAVRESLIKQSRNLRMRHVLEQVTSKTRAEVSKGVADGPFTETDIDDMFGERCWRGLQRFGVEQGVNEDGTPKCRPCDNAKRSWWRFAI